MKTAFFIFLIHFEISTVRALLDQLHGFRLYLSNNETFNRQNIVYINTDYNNGRIVINENLTGLFQFVKLDLPDTYREETDTSNTGKQSGPLVLCEVEVFVKMANIALGKPATMSSVFDGMLANKSVDGSTRLDANECNCCSHSANDANPWLTIDLLKPHTIFHISVAGRSDDPRDNRLLGGLQIYANGTQNIASGKYCSANKSGVNVTFPGGVLSQYVTLRHPDQSANHEWYLVVCEIKIFVRDCDQGTYGDICEDCGHCSNPPCSKDTGYCPRGVCMAGWTGAHCNTKGCGNNTYGPQCETCGQCKSPPCDNATGVCPGRQCLDGWHEDKCKTECIPPSYGQNCYKTCSTCNQMNCSHTDGSCFSGCLPGYKPDGFCRTQCNHSSYGQNCNETCSTCNQRNCNHTDGFCFAGCVPGYKPDGYCRTPCEIGRYGQNCTYICGDNCLHGKTQCDRKNGTCKEGCKQGFMGERCENQCPPGQYDNNCRGHCHQCKNDTICDFRNGSCPEGCNPGFNGSTCDKECHDGYFGDCTHVCHCNNSLPCSKANGYCPRGCAFGWGGNTCSTDLNLLRRISNVQTSQSGIYNGMDSSKALDGIDSYDVDNCNCCSVANGSVTSWWQIDLGQKYLIDALKIYGRAYEENIRPTRTDYQLEQATIYAANTTMSGNTKGKSIYHIPNTTDSTVFTKYLDRATIAKFLIVRRSSAILTICEFKLYEKVCNLGTFGTGCSHRCHCSDNASCDLVTGKCQTTGCLPGWRGESCELECKTRTFGERCNKTCHCINQTHCDNINGTCDLGECDPGWKDVSCNTECDNGTFGKACNRTCHCINQTHCDNVNGTCDLGKCDPGWKDVSCDAQCDTGSFGSGCNHSCHCFNKTACNNVNGSCYIGECDPGWIGEACDKECDNGTFGKACNRTCHCINQTHCNNINGTCDLGKCDPGWKNVSCDTECDAGSFGSGCNHICHCINKTACNNVNGFCYIGECDPGWIEEACDKECDVRRFGARCNQSCHCINKTTCNNVNGNCDISQCDPGWKGDSCDKECDSGNFGQNCNFTCHCKNNMKCNTISGSCLDSKCDSNWEGPSCQIHSEALGSSKDGPTSAVFGGIGAAVGLLILGILIGFIIYRRRNSKDSSADRSQFSNLDKALESKNSRKSEPHRSDMYAHENRSFEEEEETAMNSSGAGDYYSFGDQFMGIRIHELWDYIKEKMENRCEKLYSEFKTLPSGLVHPSKSADDIVNRGKNRYREMYAYDHSRVVLLDVEQGTNTDYINACYINGYDKNKKFVASQGPTKQMINDFWRMVWQLKSDKIVMLTNLIELGTPKCLQYWPKEDEEEEHCFGNVTVKVLKTEMSLDFNIRYFEARKIGEPARRIRQFHFKSWPDKDVPDSSWCLVNFWRAVDTNAASKAGPIVVHCSAGVGRTGTFIALDNLVSQARTEGCVRPLQIVETLRRQRVNMVQTREQYVYLHEAVADALLFGTHIIWTKQFPEVFTFMLQKEKGDIKTKLETQFELIERSTLDTTSEVDDTTEYTNIETLQSESAAYRPKLKNRGSKFVQELGAIYIPNYKGKNTFLITMSPDKTSMEEFWSLVDDNNIKTIIMLTETTAASYQSSCQLGSSANNGKRFKVNKIEEKIRKGYTERTFTFKESDREEEEYFTTVKQFQCTTWKDGYSVPGDTRSLFDMVNSVQKWQPHLSESQPVLIHCSNGCSRSGIVCMFLNELQRMKYEGGHINILESVKMMKKRQKYLIGTYEQYRFCFDLILTHVKTTEVYENL